MVRNPYEVLGINPSISREDAKAIYRKLVKKYHPDGSDADRARFEEVKEAWDLLKDADNAFNRKHRVVTHISLFKFRRI